MYQVLNALSGKPNYTYDDEGKSYDDLLADYNRFISSNNYYEQGAADYIKTKAQKILVDDCVKIAVTCSDSSFKDIISDKVLASPFFIDEDKQKIATICMCKHLERYDEITLEKYPKLILNLLYYRDWASDRHSWLAPTSGIDQHLNYCIKTFIPRVRENKGRPINAGKKVFSYNGKQYRTIQECANDYNISKQAMYKRLKKLNIY